MSKFKATESTEISTRNMRIIHWGGTGSRKTESVLRYYPRVLMIDIEGNGQQCVGMKEIPTFLHLRTTDVYEVADMLDAAAKGEFKFKDGKLPETVFIDGMSILWEVRKEVAADKAEARMNKWKAVSMDDVDISMREWGVAKRPMKALSTALSNAPFRYLVLSAREAPLTLPKPGGKTADDVVTVGFKMDAMKGLDYEANLAFHMFTDDQIIGNKLVVGPWKCEVTKVQGALGTPLPKGKIFDKYPFDIIAAHAANLKPSVGNAKTDMAVAKEQEKKDDAVEGKVEVKAAPKAAPVKTGFSKADLVAYAAFKQVPMDKVSIALREKPETHPDVWNPDLEPQYKAVIDALVPVQ